MIPTYGSKEAIFSFAQLMVDPDGPKDTVVVTEPGYPVPARGAAFAGARVESLPLLESNGFLPDLDAVEDWDRIALFWVNYPNNPTGATAPLAFYERLGELARGARLPPLLRRGLQRALVRRAAALRARARRPVERRRLPDALEALLDDRATAPASSPARRRSSPR